MHGRPEKYASESSLFVICTGREVIGYFLEHLSATVHVHLMSTTSYFFDFIALSADLAKHADVDATAALLLFR